MLTVTETAAKVLTEALASREEDAPEMLRIALVEGEYTLTLDNPSDEDQVIEHEGEGLVILNPEVSEGLSDFTLDAQETEAGPRLTLAKS